MPTATPPTRSLRHTLAAVAIALALVTIAGATARLGPPSAGAQAARVRDRPQQPTT